MLSLEEQRKRWEARQIVNRAVRRGELPYIRFRACKMCSGRAQVYHHEDYDKPMEVIPLCSKCHSFIHGIAKEPSPLKI